MAEWLYEEGLGENRAALVDGDTILEAAIELPGRLRAAAILAGRLTAVLVPGRRGIVTLDDGEEALIEPIPPDTSEGEELKVEIVREAIPEAGRFKLAKARASDREARPGPSLAERIRATGHAIKLLRPHEPDWLEEAGWSELLDEALTGEIAFPGGSLRMSVTPAMTLFDVDGPLPAPALAVAGAQAAARTIRRLGIGGSIGIDLPTVPDKTIRQAAAAALDALLPQPFERTQVNGFGFLQVVRRRERPSLPELLQGDPPGAAARALLRRAERTEGAGDIVIAASPAVVGRIEASWLDSLRRSRGAEVALQADPALSISAGHVHRPL